MHKPHLDRLRDLLTILEEVRDAQAPFNMALFAESEDCGTAACSLGWAARSRKFQRQGLSLERRDDWGNGILPVIKDQDGSIQHSGIGAGQFFFDISYEQACYLFTPSGFTNNRPRVDQAIERVKELISHYEPESAGSVELL